MVVMDLCESHHPKTQRTAIADALNFAPSLTRRGIGKMTAFCGLFGGV